MEFNKIFITVGTTEFNSLLQEVRKKDTLKVLKEHLKCKQLTVQRGTGEEIDYSSNSGGISIKQFDLKKSIEPEILEADLVISHAGAGTCIDVLSKGKPLIVVINDTLMDNHQIELAQKLSEEGYLYYTYVSSLTEFLKTLDVSGLKPYGKGNINRFLEYLENFMGFV